MFDTVCSLPQPSDVVCLTLHPSSPLLSVGLASGHINTYLFPSTLSPSSSITTTWQTRRHKGSCRSLAFSTDGTTLFSVGTDGIVKAALAETGRVVAKIALPTSPNNLPSVLHALSPQTLLLGTDGGRVAVYDLREHHPDPSTFASARPAQTHAPHYNAEDPDPDDHEPVTSLTPLPPTNASTSGFAKSWLTTAGSTVAVTDLRKGVVARSVNQADMLLSSCCVDAGSVGATAGGKGALVDTANTQVLVGGSLGFLTRWQRGQWEDQAERVYVGGREVGLTEDPKDSARKKSKENGAAAAKRLLRDEEEDQVTVDCLAVVPEQSGENERRGGKGAWKSAVLAAGLGTGAVRFVKAGGGNVLAQCRHDETGVEGVVGLSFDVMGRMITGGGEVVKVWHPSAEAVAEEGEEEAQTSEEDDDEDEDEDEDDNDESSEEERPPQPAPKRRKKGRGGDAGIMRFEGL